MVNNSVWYQNIRRMKEDSGFTTEEISAKSGVPLGTLIKIFSFQTKNPKLDTIKKIVNALGYTLDDLGVTSKKDQRRERDEQRILDTYSTINAYIEPL